MSETTQAHPMKGRRRGALAAASLLALASSALGQNLITNGGFASSLASWDPTADDRGTAAWSPDDANGSPSSGSVRVQSTAADTAVLVPLLTQCVPVTAGASYVVSQRAKFADGETTTGWAETTIYWYSAPDCTGFLRGDGVLTARAGAVPGYWLSSAALLTAPAGAVAAFVRLGVDKLEAGQSLTANIDDVSFTPSGGAVDEVVGWLPVAGSLAGNFGSFFKTSLKILNPNFMPISGRVVFHPAGAAESPSDPFVTYSLASGQSFSWDDVVAAIGQSGLGSLDVVVTVPPSLPGPPLPLQPPVVVARVFNDGGAAGTSGFTEPLFWPGTAVGNPPRAITAHLLPPDVDRYRYNVGIRVLTPGVNVTVEVLGVDGSVVHTTDRTYLTATLTQTTADDFAGVPLESGQSLRVTADPLRVILYGATVDNVTNDPSAQFVSAYHELSP
ncbi:MAG TPA: hypothetical protein VGH97_01160 [Thermoanaerobaculia bacterium]|jgi:hypothetical protein